MIIAQIAVVMAFLDARALQQAHAHLHGAAQRAVLKRQPKALGALGTTPDLEKLMEDENAVLGAGQVEHFHKQQLLQTLACTECGRCQDKCPAWNTGKPLNPKLVITASATRCSPSPTGSWAQAGGGAGSQDVEHEPQPLVPDVIDPDVLWSCTTCGACVEECPVDIEHVDAIVDMRRYQVLMESSFPSEAGVMLRNIENNGNPWGLSANMRMPSGPKAWSSTSRSSPTTSRTTSSGSTGSAAPARSTTVPAARPRRSRGCFHAAGVKFAILGPQESCTGDPARRIGNEYLWQEMAKANIEMLDGAGVKKIVASCPHCFNTIGNEYPALGGNYEVIHHSQLLGRLVAEGKLSPQDPSWRS